jgi:hypothetical protein
MEVKFWSASDRTVIDGRRNVGFERQVPSSKCPNPAANIGADLAQCDASHRPERSIHVSPMAQDPQAVRVMEGNRRQRHRIERYYDCTFLSAWGEQNARISSLSPIGCFIDSRTTVPPAGTVVEDITVTLPTGHLTLQGQVVYAQPGVGFAVQFTGLDENIQNQLIALVGG